jgi:Sulfotransferase family
MPLTRRGDPQQRPAPFVVGVGRSGTTLLRLMLDAHPRVAIPPETHFVPELIGRARLRVSAEELVEELVAARHWDDFGLDAGALRGRVAGLGDARAAAVLRAFYTLYAESQGKDRWGDKTPIYVKRMRLIVEVLPEARFIHLIRDGRDVALSRRRRGMGAGKPIADVAERWRRRITLARRQARRLRGRYLELRYEDLVTDPEPHLRAICELCELEFDPAMLAHHQRAEERLAELGHDLGPEGGRRERSREERLAAHAMAARPASGERAGAWRSEMSDEDRTEFEAVAGDLLAELGYDVPS